MTKTNVWLHRTARISAVVPLVAIVLNVSAASAQSLGSAQTFGVLGATTVTNTGLSVITSDVGVSPGTAITGFPPGVVVGTIHAAGMAAARAQADAGMANAEIKAMACLPINNLSNQVLGTDVLSLPPGVYCFDSSAQLTGRLVLTGDGPWIFQIASTLTTESGSSVVVLNAGTTCSGSKVFWQVGSSATLGTGTAFAGTILALASVTATTAVTVSGRAIALTGAVTMDTNGVSACVVPGPPVPPPVDKCEVDEDDDDEDDDDDDGDHHHGDHHDKDKDRDHDKDKDHDNDKDHKDNDRKDKDHSSKNKKRG